MKIIILFLFITNLMCLTGYCGENKILKEFKKAIIDKNIKQRDELYNKIKKDDKISEYLNKEENKYEKMLVERVGLSLRIKYR